MYLSGLLLKNFRSYADAAVDFSPTVNLLVGRNGQGKTNIVESIRYLSTLSSHRVASDVPLIRKDEEQAVIQAKINKGDRAIVVDATLNLGKGRLLRVNKNKVAAKDFIGLLPSVIFSPEDLNLVKGDPGQRRKFIDEIIISIQPMMLRVYQDYERVVKQRTTLLKSAKYSAGNLSTLEIWDEKLANLGAEIAFERRSLVEVINPYLERTYSEVAPGQGICELLTAAEYDSKNQAEIKEYFVHSLAENRKKEIERGVTLVGPHRDDIQINLAGMLAKTYASHGESWSCALALKIANYDLLTKDQGPYSEVNNEPVLILDDVFAELDSGRRSALVDCIEKAAQVFITAAVQEDVPDEIQAKIFNVADGEIKASAVSSLVVGGADD